MISKRPVCGVWRSAGLVGRLEQLKKMSSDPQKVEDSIAQVKLTLRLRQYVLDPGGSALCGRAAVHCMGAWQCLVWEGRRAAVLCLEAQAFSRIPFPPIRRRRPLALDGPATACD